MSPFDDFILIPSSPSQSPGPGSTTTLNSSSVVNDFLANTKGARLFTEGLIVDSIRKYHPKHHLSVTPAYSCDLISFASTHPSSVKITPHDSTASNELKERIFIPPARRYNDENGGVFIDRVVFACYDYVYNSTQFLLYVVEGSDGPYGKVVYNYLLLEDDSGGKRKGKGRAASVLVDELIQKGTEWNQELHEEVLVFDQGYWQKSRELWENVQKAEWDDVILGEDRKETIIDDVIGFFDAEKRYAEFNVPWKRGVIFYGPPGNGKTISTKALMHQVSKRTSPTIETLYVKTFNSYAGPEFGIRQIFLKARQMAPCLLIFEDIDSLVNVSVRSYFLNEVDGLESNHGILMIGSTNHLERLDPGIAKRPSRFDRKYFFDDPNREERIQYCDYWRNKLKDNKKIEFPEIMSERIADITKDFSFAYMKEAFVAALLVIVAGKDEMEVRFHLGDPLDNNILWKEIKRQVENLRKEIEDETSEITFFNPPKYRGFHIDSGLSPSRNANTIIREEDRQYPKDSRQLEIRNNMAPRYM